MLVSSSSLKFRNLTRKEKFVVNFCRIFVIVCFMWLCSCLIFIFDATRFSTNIIICPNIVVLTGAAQRIPYAFSFVKTGQVKNIFISGVYQRTRLGDILIKQDKIPGVNVILGKSAKNTNENAKEIVEWLRLNKINELTLITSDYHIRRSIVELKNSCSDLIIHPVAVESKNNFFFVWTCVKEFHKTCYACFKNLICR